MTRVALVTGGSRGIGRATALRFLKEGWNVAIFYASDEESANEVVATDPGRCRAYRCDVSDEAMVRESVAQIEADLGPVEVLVNNAGVHRGGSMHRVSLEDFRKVIDVALVGTRNCAIAVLKGMRERNSGHIINVSSAVALIGWRGDTAYAAAKAGQIGLTRAMAKEVAADGVRVNAIVPGFIETDMTKNVSESQRRQLAHRTLLGQIGTPDQVAGMIYSVATEGSYMTGTIVTVDGGMVLGRDEALTEENGL